MATAVVATTAAAAKVFIVVMTSPYGFTKGGMEMSGSTAVHVPHASKPERLATQTQPCSTLSRRRSSL